MLPYLTFYWLSLKSSNRRNSDAYHSHTAPPHYLTNLPDRLKLYMHNRHKLGSADSSGYNHKSWPAAMAEANL
eukprot:1154318-Pelagomonas_calceolata.AAC.3